MVPNPSGLNAHETVDSLAAAYAEPARAAGIIALTQISASSPVAGSRSVMQ